MTERAGYEKQLTESGQSIDAHMTKAEDDFSFATTARQRFENGGMEVRTDIARRLGSNLTLRDGIISMDGSNLLHLLKRSNEKIRAITNDTLEPEKSIDEYTKYGTQNEVISTLQGYKDSNLDGRFWRPQCYRYIIALSRAEFVTCRNSHSSRSLYRILLELSARI